jgi:hypothetical protein
MVPTSQLYKDIQVNNLSKKCLQDVESVGNNKYIIKLEFDNN